MTTVERTLRTAPAARARLLDRVATRVLERELRNLEGGSLAVTLPDGSRRRFGNGPAVSLTINDAALFRRLATRGTVGFGESYTAGEWDSSDLVGLFELLLRNADAANARNGFLRRLVHARPRPNRRNGILRARSNIAYHYDLGNELFELMLDETMTYSCGVFETGEATLGDAQRAKLERVCDKLQLTADDHVLEIGCGWGGFALHAARTTGCRVTGLTISAEQARFARARIAEAGLADRIEILEEDYRVHDGGYTKVASIEMLEAIGEKQFPLYFRAIDRMLEPGLAYCEAAFRVRSLRDVQLTLRRAYAR